MIKALKIKQVYYTYDKWEDYQSGMYNMTFNEILIDKAVKVLSTEKLFENIAKKVISSWDMSCIVNFTNNSCNKLAWLGQASCCYKYNVPEMATRIAWGKLSNDQREKANDIAQKIIEIWTRKYIIKRYAERQFTINFKG